MTVLIVNFLIAAQGYSVPLYRQAILPRSHETSEGRRWVLATAAKRTFPRLPPWQQFAPSRHRAPARIGHDLPV
jgi:hypothetical protein